jgi:hypothetical protein
MTDLTGRPGQRLCGWCDTEIGVWFWPTPSFVYVVGKTGEYQTIKAGWHGCDACTVLFEAGWRDYPRDDSLEFWEQVTLERSRRSLLVRHVVDVRSAAGARLSPTDESELDGWMKIAELHLTGLTRERAE